MKNFVERDRTNWLLSGILVLASATSMAVIFNFISIQWKAPSQMSYSQQSESTTTKKPPSVSALGFLEPEGEVIKVSGPAFAEGTRVEKLLVRRGDKVSKGEVIATLDNRSRLSANVKKAETKIMVAQAKLEQVKAGAKQGELEAQKAKIKNLEAELQGQILVQNATVEKLKAELEGRKEAKKAEIERLKAELNNAQTECKRYQVLYQDGVVTTSAKDQKCLTEQTLVKQLMESETNLTEIKLTGETRIKEAEANLQRTKITLSEQLTEAKATLDKIAEVRPVDVSLAEAELQSAQADLNQAKAELDLAYVYAPQNGQILEIKTRPGELVNSEGIVLLGETEQMYVNAEIYETDIHNIKLGQKATITTQNFADPLQGIVDEIGLAIGKKDVLGTDPVADVDARVVPVKIRLDSSSSQKVSNLTNLQVRVVIDTTN